LHLIGARKEMKKSPSPSCGAHLHFFRQFQGPRSTKSGQPIYGPDSEATRSAQRADPAKRCDAHHSAKKIIFFSGFAGGLRAMMNLYDKTCSLAGPAQPPEFS
jgi:hypothetical protein